MKRYPIRQDRLPFLSIQEKAERSLLSDALSIKDIGTLWLEDKHERYCFYADIIEDCKAGIIKYCGDIDDLDVNVEAWQSGYYAQKYPNTPYESLNYLEKADRDKESMEAYWKAFDKGDIFEISNPPKCLTHRDDFKVYLQMENAWPVTDCLLANWWSESEQQIELLNERQKAIAQIKASSATNSNLTTQQLLDKPVSEIVEDSRLLNAKDFDYFFNLFVWRRQLVQEQQIPQSRYPNKKDYDERMQSVNAKIEEIDRYINNQPVSNTTAKSVVEWNETLNNGEPINWGFWLGLENIRPEQAAKLTHNIDPRVWHDDKYAAGGPYGAHCNGNKIDNELLIKIRSLEQQLDNRSKNWSLVDLVSFLGEENAPLGMLEAVKELTESEPASTMTDEKGSQDNNPGSDGESKGRRNRQVDLICKTAKELIYDLLNIPEGGKKAIKTECLKDTSLFTEDAFKKAWQEANRRNLIRMNDKEKYLSNQ